MSMDKTVDVSHAARMLAAGKCRYSAVGACRHDPQKPPADSC